ncbi:MAG TPA: protease complex subunit PrcB family protein [Gemmatimonadaceae bacterium]|jgi:hypothetical protein|nr:protease complex subunit PrcB family protein [Gemmatimonadaceae bacterium]
MTRRGAWLVGVAVGILSRAGFATGQPAPPDRQPKEIVPLTRFAIGPGAFVEYSGINDSLRIVVRDSVTWRQTWERINAPFIPLPQRPAVDFDREMVVVAGMGRKPTGGYDLEIERAVEDSSGIEVLIKRTIPGDRCLLSAAVTQPVDLARMPASSRPVRFREREQASPCGGRSE